MSVEVLMGERGLMEWGIRDGVFDEKYGRGFEIGHTWGTLWMRVYAANIE